MMWLLSLPLLLPFLAGPACRALVTSLAPQQAVRLLAGSAAGLAAGSTAALALLVVPGATHLRPVAALGHLLTPLASGAPGAVIAITVVAGSLLAARGVLLLRGAYRWWQRLRRARVLAAGSRSELVVLQEEHPDAYALPGRPGRIVITSGMLRALSAEEREVLLAHERAHLKGRHHLLVGMAELAAHCHPGLRAVREPLRYALERCADEYAAQAVGDRHLAARAIARAALAARTSPDRYRPGFALAATTGPVPRRVAALLDGSGRARARSSHRLAAVALLACLFVSAGASLQAADDLHSGIEIAQGETGEE
ncbi:M56 family metallopeptidase [Streptomyces sp. NRRL S-244]|uniref:M56 family metallopeptidase n=1 Tax=Streptomyces sp. NRRL S-244 TaxID=1463897 RepID=UPI0004C173D2|nr:M56 family metallopeptidase [Streptomyces sp. NRRL S-244]